MSTVDIGKTGEDIAQGYLEKKGHKIVGRNHKNKYGEIDLITKDKDTLVFVEVRTRAGERFGTPEDSLNSKKKKKLFKNAGIYALSNNYSGDYRIDFVGVVLNRKGEAERISHYKNISV